MFFYSPLTLNLRMIEWLYTKIINTGKKIEIDFKLKPTKQTTFNTIDGNSIKTVFTYMTPSDLSQSTVALHPSSIE